ncbi:MAG TPA: hypothetical protein VK483_01175, partial [Chitinophagaceae bacterium]|nr:hypothetical protein [Chitinophagaceae bacterium]
IAYPLSFIEDNPIGWIAHLNPLTGIVEAFKFALFNNAPFHQAALIYSIFFTVIILFGGLLIFNKVEKNFMDTV